MGNGEVLSKLYPEHEITIRELSKKLPGYELWVLNVYTGKELIIEIR